MYNVNYSGIPFRPSFGDFIPGSDATQIRIQIKTVASGESAGFRFNIIPVHDGMEERPRVFMLDDYQSGAFVTLTVQDLKESGTYTFTATAQNDIGESEVASSHSIVIIPSPPQPGSLSHSLSTSLSKLSFSLSVLIY